MYRPTHVFIYFNYVQAYELSKISAFQKKNILDGFSNVKYV